MTRNRHFNAAEAKLQTVSEWMMADYFGNLLIEPDELNDLPE